MNIVVVSCDPPCKEGKVRYTTILIKPLTDHRR